MSVADADALRMREINQKLQEWVELSRSAIDDGPPKVSGDLSLTMQRTENLLMVSKSLRSISEQVRSFASAARRQAAKCQQGAR